MEGRFRRTRGGVAGMALTGASSRCVGADKPTLVVDGAPLATRVVAATATEEPRRVG